MNLFERFWKIVDEKREAARTTGSELDLSLTTVHPPSGVQNEAARDLTSIVRRAPRRHPPMVVSQPAKSQRPFCLIYTVAGDELPQFQQMFETYLDKNEFMTETFLRLRPHCELPYVLFIGQTHFYLYDTAAEELLRWGTEIGALQELLIAPLSAGADVKQAWDAIARKELTQRAEELARWLDLWRARIGARTSATPAFMLNVLQKAMLLFLYDWHFGLQDDDLVLRAAFLEQREAARARKGSALSRRMPFDGVAWMHQASEEVCRKLHIDFLFWTQAEANFFALINADTRRHFSDFIMEILQLSHAKLISPVQADVFCTPDAKLKYWKYAVTESVSVKRSLAADEVNVYQPINIDLEASGVAWALHVVDQTLEYWRERCEALTRQLTQQKSLGLQFDLFVESDLDREGVPCIEDVPDTTFGRSIRVHYDFPIERATLEYLVLLRTFELCKEWHIALKPLDCIAEMFVHKERMSDVEEI